MENGITRSISHVTWEMFAMCSPWEIIRPLGANIRVGRARQGVRGGALLICNLFIIFILEQ